VRVVGEDDVGADEDVVLDGHELEKAAAVDAHAAADAVTELEDGVGADADVVADLVVLADAGALAGLQASAEGAPGVDGGERPYDDGAGADGDDAGIRGRPDRLVRPSDHLGTDLLAALESSGAVPCGDERVESLLEVGARDHGADDLELDRPQRRVNVVGRRQRIRDVDAVRLDRLRRRGVRLRRHDEESIGASGGHDDDQQHEPLTPPDDEVVPQGAAFCSVHTRHHVAVIVAHGIRHD